MNIFEALGAADYIHVDENGNAHVEDMEWPTSRYFNQLEIRGVNLCDDDFLIKKESYDKFLEYQIEIENGVKYSGLARRPYYRMRGKSVTKEQAFDIIRRTDMFFW